MPDDTDTLLLQLPSNGLSLGNVALRESLGWDESRFAAARDALVPAGLAERGRGDAPFPGISKANFRPISMVLPPREVMAAFTAKVAPLYSQITANLHQSRTLAELRDSLLPKLLSWEMYTGSAVSPH